MIISLIDFNRDIKEYDCNVEIIIIYYMYICGFRGLVCLSG